MDIPKTPPPRPPFPPSKRNKADGQAVHSPKTGRKVSTASPKSSGLSTAQVGEQAKKHLGARDIGSVAIQIEPDLPSIRSDSTNIKAQDAPGIPDGTLFVEAGDDPEAAAEKAVGQIKEEHGEETANKAKSFFKGVLDFCKKNKSTILAVAGFALLVGGVAGGLAFPAVFILAAPGIIMLGCGMGGILDEIPLPAVPDETTPQPGIKPQSEETKPTPPESKKKEGEEDDKDTSKKNAATTDGTQTTATVTTPEPPPPPPLPPVPIRPGEKGYEAYKEMVALRKKLKGQEVSAHFLPANPSARKYSEMLGCLKDTQKPEAGSQLREEDFKDVDVEQLLKEKNLTEDECKNIYATYSKVAVGYDFFLWAKGNEEKEFEGTLQKIYPAIGQIKYEELLALRRSVKREALKLTVEAIQNKEKLDAERIATKAIKNLETFSERLTPPLGRVRDKQSRESDFVKGVNTFLSDYAGSLKLKQA